MLDLYLAGFAFALGAISALACCALAAFAAWTAYQAALAYAYRVRQSLADYRRAVAAGTMGPAYFGFWNQPFPVRGGVWFILWWQGVEDRLRRHEVAS